MRGSRFVWKKICYGQLVCENFGTEIKNAALDNLLKYDLFKCTMAQWPPALLSVNTGCSPPACGATL